MTIGPDYVFICIPRTASMSIGRGWLPTLYGGVDLSAGMYHGTDVPEEHLHKFTWTIVRNPYDRMLSLYHLTRTSTVERMIRDKMPLDINAAEFVDWCVWRGDADSRWWNQSAYFRRARMDCWVCFEALDEGLQSLPFVQVYTPPRRVNATVRPPMEEELTADFIRAVNIHSAEDFERFGYQRRG